MKYLLLILLFLIACERSPERIGKTTEYYDFQCLKTETNTGLGFSTSGNVVMTSTDNCIVAKCFLMKRTLGKYVWEFKEQRIKLVEDEKCIR